MSHSYSQNHLHIVFSTKDRQKLIEPAMQPKLWAYMAGIGRNHGFLVLANGGMADHLHLLIQLPPVLALAKAISLVKSNSANWMNEHGLEFNWQQVYRATCVQFETVQSPGIAYVFLNGPRWLKDVKLTRQCGSIRTPI